MFFPEKDTYGMEAVHGGLQVYKHRCPPPFVFSPLHAVLEYDACVRGSAPNGFDLHLRVLYDLVRNGWVFAKGCHDISLAVSKYRLLQDQLVGAMGMHDLIWAYGVCEAMMASGDREFKVRSFETSARLAAPYNAARILGWVKVKPTEVGRMCISLTPSAHSWGSREFLQETTRRRPFRDGFPRIGREALAMEVAAT